ncbi:hypothetical protein [Rhodococcus sp. MTM3W5.2]|uniref:hypothetical protein n=1 Tax=Rhodococcus sp. MTM3W5.2 TaxID=1805827 RepID=UPI0011AE44FF|nr:hypothetical protein [Rhodococcus sp. MTM3W5.2]
MSVIGTPGPQPIVGEVNANRPKELAMLVVTRGEPTRTSTAALFASELAAALRRSWMPSDWGSAPAVPANTRVAVAPIANAAVVRRARFLPFTQCSSCRVLLRGEGTG